MIYQYILENTDSKTGIKFYQCIYFKQTSENAFFLSEIYNERRNKIIVLFVPKEGDRSTAWVSQGHMRHVPLYYNY